MGNNMVNRKLNKRGEDPTNKRVSQKNIKLSATFIKMVFIESLTTWKDV